MAMPKRRPVNEPAPIQLGDEVEMRKPHACGTNHWVVTRTGADIRIQCAACGRSVLMPREKFVRARKRVLRASGE